MSKRSRSTWGVALLLAAAGCGGEVGARDQWLVRLDTDLRVPQFGDRVVVEVVQSDGALACSDCRRVIGAGHAEDWPISFGIEATRDAPRLRARLYRSKLTGPDGFPVGSAFVDVSGRLPVARGVTRVELLLGLDCFGKPPDPANGISCDPSTGAVGPEPLLHDRADVPGLSAFLEDTPCPRAAPADMVCIPGGAFLLGNPTWLALYPELASAPEHLVRLSPYALDRDEVTIGVVRQLLLDKVIGIGPMPHGTLNEIVSACSFLGPDDPSNDALPANCVDASLAREVCEALGKRLPTEAEWEYAAGNREAETTYPWGEDTDICAHAIVARGRTSEEIGADTVEQVACRSTSTAEALPWGTVAGGHPGDVTALGVRNMGGNVSEHVSDAFAAYADGCWAQGVVLTDPHCDEPESYPTLGTTWSARGGRWPSGAWSAVNTNRNSLLLGDWTPQTGIRCALSASDFP